MTMTAVDDMARALLGEHEARAPFTPLDAGRQGDLHFAYAVQDRLIRLRRDAGAGAVAGWKIGFTTAPMQALAGIREPAAGALLAQGLRRSGDVLQGADLVHLGLEGEIAVRIGRPFPETEAIDPSEVLERLESVASAMEITDDRNADWSLIEAASMVCDNIWNIGAVIGPPTPAAEVGALVGRRGTMSIDGAVFEEGMSQDIGCDTLEIIAWLGAHLARRGQPLQPGQWVMTGSFVSTTFPAPGAHYRWAVEGLEPVEVSIA